MPPRIEILVHVSGPSRGADDARYRREAEGLLEWRPAKRLDILREGGQRDQDYDLDRQELNESWNSSSEFRHQHREQVPDSTIFATSPVHEHEQPQSRLSQDAETSSTSDMVPRTPMPAFIPPVFPPPPSTSATSRVPATPNLLVKRTPYTPVQGPQTASSPTLPHVNHNPIQQRAVSTAAASSWQTPPSVIPNSQPTPSPEAGCPDPLIIASQFSEARISAPNPLRGSRVEAEERDPTPQKRKSPQQGFNSSPAPKRPCQEPNPSSPPYLTSSPTATNPTNQPTSRLTTKEIHPPHPPTSSSTTPTTFTTHLTPSLSAFAAKAPLSEFFLPYVTITRRLNPLERGHWRIPFSFLRPGGLTPETQIKLWQYLERFVGSGSLGWGVWCVREEETDVETEESTELVRTTVSGREDCEVEADGARKREVLKVYCWGEVMGEVYLALWAGSNRALRKVPEVVWIDAAGEAVVKMR